MKAPETKAVQIRSSVHKLLKRHCAATGQVMGAFTAAAIREQIRRDRAGK